MDIKTLSPADRKALMAQLEDEQKAEKLAKEENKKTLNKMINELVNSKAPILANFGLQQNKVVDSTFQDFASAIALRKEIYNVKKDNASHTFTSEDGNGSITIGYNEIIGFNGTESAGVEKIKEVLQGLSADDDNREILADLLSTFMKPDKKGNLNPTKIIELTSKKEKVNNPLFSEGVDIIVAAQFKTRTSMYVRGWYRQLGENNKEVKVSFSITANDK